MRNYPDLINAYLEYVSGHEATAKVHKWSFISALAGCMERRLWLDRGYYTLFPNLYIFIVGRSGLIKKSTTTAIAVNLIREIESLSFMSERLTPSSLMTQLKHSGKQFEYKGRSINQSAVFAYASELAVFMDDIFGSIVELLTTFYDCIPWDSDKPWVHNTKSQGNLEIYGPCLNLLGASTKTWLTKILPTDQVEGGFTSRVIFVVENEVPDKLVPWPQRIENDTLSKEKLLQDLRRITELCGPFAVTEEAKKFFSTWYEKHMKSDVPMNSDPLLAGYMGRKGDLVLKLGMVRSISISDDLVINQSHMQWALNELDSLEPDMRSAMASKYEFRANDLQYELRNFVRSRGKAEKSEIIKIYGKIYPGHQIMASIDTLKMLGEITERGPFLFVPELVF